uniref:Uncharacterized protein n=1 Tax=Steinernema glaseri TaxID=37863 RepID=A0A1I8AQI3_9BILA
MGSSFVGVGSWRWGYVHVPINMFSKSFIKLLAIKAVQLSSESGSASSPGAWKRLFLISCSGHASGGRVLGIPRGSHSVVAEGNDSGSGHGGGSGPRSHSRGSSGRANRIAPRRTRRRRAEGAGEREIPWWVKKPKKSLDGSSESASFMHVLMATGYTPRPSCVLQTQKIKRRTVRRAGSRRGQTGLATEKKRNCQHCALWGRDGSTAALKATTGTGSTFEQGVRHFVRLETLLVLLSTGSLGLKSEGADVSGK